MKAGLISSAVLILTLLILPIVVLSSFTNLSAVADSGINGPYLYTGPNVEGDTYDFGNCTYWVYKLRLEASNPIPNNWGNAIDWAKNAIKDGYLVDQNPEVGSIFQNSNASGGLGHVAYVIEIDEDSKTFTISEMNHLGLDIVDTRKFNLNDENKYEFIHDKR